MSNNQKYIRVCTSFYDTGRLIKKEDLDKVLQRDDIQELYASTFYYNEEQYKEFQLKKSIKGVRNVKTDKIWFDFDNETNPELSRKDAIIVIDRLKKAGFKEKAIQVYFSGSKGINVIVNLNKDLNPVQVSTICSKFAKDLETFDTSMYDSAQILRVPTTKHQKTNNYKIPITIDELNKLDINQIKQKSSKIDKQEMLAKSNQWESDILPDGLDVVESEPVKEKREPMAFDLKNKPREWRDYKWALLNAYMVKPEERHASLMVLAATCRSLGYTEEYAKAMCLVFDEKFVKATGKPPVEDLESNILPAVYSDTWNGGAYSYKNNLFLQQYVSRIGAEPEKNDKTILSIDDVFTEFEDFSQNFEKNIVKTGILDLDMNSLFLTSTHNGILGQPGSGKTSLVIQWLEYLSNKGESCFFYSLDMAESIIYAKLVQRITGYDTRKSMSLSKSNPAEFIEVTEKIKEKYKNIQFVFTAGTTVDSMKEGIRKYESESGNKVRLVIVDYLECLTGPYSDATANTGFISQQMKDLAREMRVCSVMLLQTQKNSGGGDVSEPLLSMKQIKGSSVIEQSCATILTLWREGYSPKFQNQDKFMSFAIVKNRFGRLWTDDFGWEGQRGQVGNMLGDEGREDLNKLRQEKKAAKAADNKDDGWN